MGYDHKVLDSLKDAVGSVIVDRNRTPEATLERCRNMQSLPKNIAAMSLRATLQLFETLMYWCDDSNVQCDASNMWSLWAERMHRICDAHCKWYHKQRFGKLEKNNNANDSEGLNWILFNTWANTDEDRADQRSNEQCTVAARKGTWHEIPQRSRNKSLLTNLWAKCWAFMVYRIAWSQSL